MSFLCSYISFNASSLYLRSSTDVSHLIEVELLCEAPQNVDVEKQFYNRWFLRDERELTMKYIKRL